MTPFATIHTHLSTETRAKPLSARLPAVARISMGLVFFLFGLIGLLSAVGLVPLSQPSTPPPDAAAAFTAALMKTGYLFPLVKGTECAAGALLLSNRFVPLALALIAPVVVNIVAFHAFLAPSGLGIAALMLALELYLAWTQRDAYLPMLKVRL